MPFQKFRINWGTSDDGILMYPPVAFLPGVYISFGIEIKAIESVVSLPVRQTTLERLESERSEITEPSVSN